jgi:hypothetical protein
MRHLIVSLALLAGCSHGDLSPGGLQLEPTPVELGSVRISGYHSATGSPRTTVVAGFATTEGKPGPCSSAMVFATTEGKPGPCSSAMVSGCTAVLTAIPVVAAPMPRQAGTRAWVLHGGAVERQDLGLLSYLGETRDEVDLLEEKVPKLLGLA